MTPADDRLVDSVRGLALTLPPSSLKALVAALESMPGPTGPGLLSLFDAIPSPAARASVSAVVQAWKDCPGVDGRSVSLMTSCAATMRDLVETSQALSAVWTGPSTRYVPLRHSRQALQDVIRFARKRLVVVSFAAYRVQAVLDDLCEAVQRGVDVRLILETKADSGGKLGQDAAAALNDLPASVEFYVWPGKMRESPHSSLHAKAALADGELALVTSANLTASALDRNMELGLLVRGGPLPADLLHHFDELISAGHLQLAEGG